MATTLGADPPRSASDVCILIVDDDASKRIALRAALLPLGHEIVEADSGRAALRCLMSQDFAVILLDVRMPEMNGFETASVIRMRERSELTPIIFITAYSSDDLRPGDRYAEGAVDFMTAPVRPEELRAKVIVFASLFAHNQALETGSRVATFTDRWKLLLDHLPVGVFQTDDADRCVYTNSRWTELTGIASADALGRTIGTLLGAKAAASCGAPGGGTFELRLTGGDRSLVDVRTASLPAGAARGTGRVGTLDLVPVDPRVPEPDDAVADAQDRGSRGERDRLADLVTAFGAEMRASMQAFNASLEGPLERHDSSRPAAAIPGTAA